MYITRKGQYALFFLIDLALHDGSTVTVKQVAKEYDLSEKYMEQVASKLRHAGIVHVIRGSKGGYYLPEETRRCTAKDVVGAIDGQRNAAQHGRSVNFFFQVLQIDQILIQSSSLSPNR